jgi:ABC-type multidrug transport system ATPase subunit
MFSSCSDVKHFSESFDTNKCVPYQAHRLSTIANSDRIAFIADGKVLEYGKPAELLQKPHGRYKRLVDAQKRGATLESLLAKSKKDKEGGDDEEEEKEEQEKMKHQEEEDEEKAFNFKRAMRLASPDVSYILLGESHYCVGLLNS